jgi:hypothetical protein
MLREFFPAALLAFDDLAAPDVLELLGRAPDPVSAARLSTTLITAALKRVHRHHASAKATTIQTSLRSRELGQPPTTTSSAPAASATTPRCANSVTAWSASCTAASRPAAATTRPSRGHATNKVYELPLDT